MIGTVVAVAVGGYALYKILSGKTEKAVSPPGTADGSFVTVGGLRFYAPGTADRTLKNFGDYGLVPMPSALDGVPQGSAAVFALAGRGGGGAAGPTAQQAVLAAAQQKGIVVLTTVNAAVRLDTRTVDQFGDVFLVFASPDSKLALAGLDKPYAILVDA